MSDGRFAAALQAAQKGDAGALAPLIAATPGLVNARSDTGATLLGAAATAMTGDHNAWDGEAAPGIAAVVRLLLAAGADPSAADERGWTPLHSATIGGSVDLAGLLAGAGADGGTGAFGVRSATPLAFALFYGHPDCARVVLGAPRGRTPDDLRVTAGLGDLPRLDAWLDPGRPLPESASSGFDFAGPPQWLPPRDAPIDDQLVLDEALSWAARSDQVESMERLVRAGADVNSNAYRGTPLLWAIFSDAVAAATWLLDHGADPDLRHDFGGSEHGKGATAMHLAAQYSRLKCLQLLLNRGADPTILDEKFSATPLGWARHSEADDAVALLEGHLGE